MRIELRQLTNLPAVQAQNFDLHEDYGFACFIENGTNMTIFLNGVPCRSWAFGQHPHIDSVRWFNRKEVICGYDVSSTMLISATKVQKLYTGHPDFLLVSNNYIFVGYSEEDMNTGGPLDFVGDGLAAFTHRGAYVAGAQKFLTKAIQPSIDEISAGYVFNDNIFFIAYCEEMIFRFDPAQMELGYFPVAFQEPFSIVNADVFTGDDKQAYAIFDKRVLLSEHPERPAFECATFDLVAKTGSKADFTPIEEELIAAGFNMSEIKFLPNSIGRIIVSDTTKAALLEISDFL
jgi:hypothetical protein